MKTLLAGLLLFGCAGVLAAAYEPPRTPDGKPDLQGVWTSATLTNLERPDDVTALVLTPEQARAREQANAEVYAENNAPTPDAVAPEAGGDVGGYNYYWLDPGTRLAVVNGEIRSSLIVDPPSGKIPYSPAGLARYGRAAAKFRGTDDPEQRTLGDRCLVGYGSSGGPPMLPVLYNNNMQIVQTPDHVMILVEMNHDARIVRMNDEHLPAHVRPWLGDSIGWWDGDTLVVETTNLRPDQSVRLAIRHRLFVPETATVTERFTRIADDQILYRFDISDPEVYTQTWAGEIPLNRSPERIYEYACHEGNYALPGILAGARQAERNATGE